MKQCLPLFLVAAFSLSSCGAKPADATTDAVKTTVTTPATTKTTNTKVDVPVAPSKNPERTAFLEEYADCQCKSMTTIFDLTAAIKTAAADKKKELERKLSDAQNSSCDKKFKTQMAAIPQAEIRQASAELDMFFEKNCGDKLLELQNQ